jgi:hypothetical protein
MLQKVFYFYYCYLEVLKVYYMAMRCWSLLQIHMAEEKYQFSLELFFSMP